jgi:hypothetical protein
MSIIYFQNSNEKWWQKPLVSFRGSIIPAELAILRIELNQNEDGVWINSRSGKSGVINLLKINHKFITIRKIIPKIVENKLEEIYKKTTSRNGFPDLVIWNRKTFTIRFVEVKCPLWDKVRAGQEEFIKIANEMGLFVKIAEWEFENAQPANRADLAFG